MKGKLIGVIGLILLGSVWSCSKNEPTLDEQQFELITEIYPEEGGTLTPNTGNFNGNTLLSLYARPHFGWIFDHWEGSIVGNQNPFPVYFFRPVAVRAVFVRDTFQIRTLAGGNGKGNEPNQFSYPTGIAIDQGGALFVSDMHNHRIQRFLPGTSEGVTILGGNGFGFGANQLDEPGKIVLDEAGNLYIADTGNNRIQKWVRGTSEGVTVAGGKGWGNGLNKLDQPFGITLDKIGNLYITELENHRVMRWKPYAEEGEVIAGGNGEGNAADQLAYPLGVAVDEDLNVYVADSYNHRIQLFTPGATAGITLLSAEDLGSPQEFNYFSGIKLGKNKQLYLSDYQKRRVLQFDLTTKAVQIVAGDHGDGGNTDQLAHPYQLDVNPLGDIIIADAKNNRIQKWMPPELQ